MFYFAAEEGPHIAIAPEKLFEVGQFTITNSMVYGWLSAILIIGLFSYLARRITFKGSKGPAQLLDAGTDFIIINVLQPNLNSRAKAVKYAPLFVTTFFFIVVNNWLGLLPGVGPAFHYGETPIFRPFTADFNGTLAIALVMITIVQALAIRESGLLRHIRHYFQGSLKNPMTLALGVMEIFSELTRLFSLALRLFLNVVIGEILIAVFAFLGGTAAPVAALPFVLLEIFVGLLQAYIFVMLCASYLGVAIAHTHDPEHTQPAPDKLAQARA